MSELFPGKYNCNQLYLKNLAVFLSYVQPLGRIGMRMHTINTLLFKYGTNSERRRVSFCHGFSFVVNGSKIGAKTMAPSNFSEAHCCSEVHSKQHFCGLTQINTRQLRKIYT